MSRFFILLLFALASTAQGEVFSLHSGGEVRGQLLNKDESPRKNYHIKTTTGAHVSLAASQVKSVRPQKAVELEYDTERWNYDDTVADQWKLAEWCREKGLLKERGEHLENIIKLEPDHAEARRGLGYSQIEGEWRKQDEYMKSKGYVYFRSRWRTPQEIELLERENKNELAEKEWIRKVKRWRGLLNRPGDAETARKEFLAIEDPYAVKALAAAIKVERSRDVSLLYVESLTHIGSPGAMNVLVDTSMEHVDVEVRTVALERIVRAGYKDAVGAYVQKLKSMDNLVVNRAGAALATMNDQSAVGPLIEALVTKHKFKIKPQNPGQMSSTFGTGGSSPGGFAFGEPKEQTITQRLPNADVLSALAILTNKNFNYDVPAWKYWYASQKKPASLDARRD